LLCTYETIAFHEFFYLAIPKSFLEANKEMIRYVNRLSDYLFVLMRQINKEAGNKEKKLETIK